MKHLLNLFFVTICFAASAQESGEASVQRTIETFFDGFHNQDSTIIKKTVSHTVILQTIAKDKEGKEYVRKDKFPDFLKSIVGIPKTTKFEEKIKSYHIQIDGAMAHAWTPYEFWINGEFHHCGVNSFQLFRDGDHWKIIYLIDTRRKGGCD
ncbi:nuclear transport factor 2 family protein [Ulvibacterium marinum]|uniref:nuclear transport factor 2 family protein n=1 Tax=Ulvibacterium marinum TaxID=2419782 RepID=UPI00249478DC|nr:nuclear transport factor 2 family protein [Ulvibacterium marinum]